MVTVRLKNLRLAANENQSDIAKILNITREAYSMYETGKRQPSYETLALLASHYNVNMEYLLGRSDHPDPIISITSEERCLLDFFRKADMRGKENLLNMGKLEAARSCIMRENRIQNMK